MDLDGKFCSRCRISYSASDNFCEHCSGPLERLSEDPPGADDLRPAAGPGLEGEPASTPARRFPEQKKIVVGLIAALLLVLLVAVLTSIHQAGQFTLTVRVRDAAGLKIGDSVLLRGTDIGEVDGVRLNEGEGILVSLRIRNENAARLKRNCLVWVGYQNWLTGRKCVKFRVLDEASEPLPSGETIQGINSFSELSAKMAPELWKELKEDLKDVLR